MTEQEARYMIDDISWVYKGTYITEQMRNECREVCTNALEKQIAKKMLARNDKRQIFMCSCGSTRICSIDSYCSVCGQKLSWESETE